MENPTVIPIMALLAIITAGIAWIFAVASSINAKKVTETDISKVILRPYFWRTSPATKAAKMAPNGGELAGKSQKYNF